MHECCGIVCDCDDEDTWVSWPENQDCDHGCEEEGDDMGDDDEYED